jgi:hypothetical protein
MIDNELTPPIGIPHILKDSREETITISKVGVEKSPYGLNEILKLNPIIYREMTPIGVIRNHEGNKISGFNDKDLENLMPGVDLTNDAIIGALVNAIKELKEEITQLKKQESRVIVISK